jgi:hypothetical protein
MGTNPFREKRTLSAEQVAERLARAKNEGLPLRGPG